MGLWGYDMTWRTKQPLESYGPIRSHHRVGEKTLESLVKPLTSQKDIFWKRIFQFHWWDLLVLTKISCANGPRLCWWL